MIDADNPVVKLIIEGTQAEFGGKSNEARSLYWQAWQAVENDYEACIAAHYVARFQDSPQEILRWNQEALRRAQAVQDGRVDDFYPSLYLNLGRSYELLGNLEEAQRYYDKVSGFLSG